MKHIKPDPDHVISRADEAVRDELKRLLADIEEGRLDHLFADVSPADEIDLSAFIPPDPGPEICAIETLPD